MPKNRVQTAIFTIMMVLVMVYGMICYNITLEVGGLSNFVFLEALPELAFMGPIAFLLDMLVVSPIVSRRAVKVVGPHPQTPFAMVAAISALSVQLMCPLMSLAATLIIKRPANVNILATWIQTTVLNLPMAFFWQIFFAGPMVRAIFGKLFREKEAQVMQEEETYLEGKQKDISDETILLDLKKGLPDEVSEAVLEVILSMEELPALIERMNADR